MDVNLKLELEKIEGKVTLYRLFGIFNFYLKYDGFLSNIISFLLNKDFKNFKNIFKKKKSVYFKQGTPSLINCLEKKLNESNVEVLLNKKITKINFDKRISLITKSGEIIKSNKIEQKTFKENKPFFSILKDFISNYSVLLNLVSLFKKDILLSKEYKSSKFQKINIEKIKKQILLFQKIDNVKFKFKIKKINLNSFIFEKL